MLHTIFGLYRALEEGMAYRRIAAQCGDNPAEMTRRITAVMLHRHGVPAPVSVELPIVETVEEVAGQAA